jgi:hypothetical protein
MANIFKVYPINNEDKPNLFELIFGKRKNSEVIKPIFVQGYEYRFLDNKQSVLFMAKFHEKSKVDGLPYFVYNRVADYSLATDVKYVKADNGLFKIRKVETVAVANITI